MKRKIFKSVWSFLLIALMATSCSSPFHSRSLVSHVNISQRSLNSLVSSDSGAVVSCCAGSSGEAKCVGGLYCGACKTCEYCEYCNSGGSCSVCAGSVAPASTSRYGSSSQGQISFWTDTVIGGSIQIYVDGEYIGELDSY